MPNPVFVDVPKNTMTKVATAVTVGQIHHVRGKEKGTFSSTYVVTGDPAPTVDKCVGGRIFLGGDTAQISASAPIDVYLYLDGSQDGRVRIDI